VDLAEQGCSSVIVSSELEELMRVCDRYSSSAVSHGRRTADSATANELMQSIAAMMSRWRASRDSKDVGKFLLRNGFSRRAAVHVCVVFADDAFFQLQTFSIFCTRCRHWR